MQRQRGLDQARRPGGGVEMADVGLDRADPAEAGLRRGLAERRRQRRHLDRIAERCAGAVALDVADAVRRHPRDRMRLGDRGGLPVHARRQIPGLVGAVVVDRSALDHRPDMVAVAQRIRQPPQRQHPGAAAEHRALRAVVEGVAMPVRRQDLALLVEIAPAMRQLDGRAAGQRHVAFAAQQRLTGEMRRHQRGRAGGLDVDARPLEIEHMAQPGRQEILVVAGVAQQEHADAVDQIPVRTQVEVEIAPHAAAGVDPDPAGKALGRMARALQRLPGGFEELAVLRVHDRRFLRAEAEELAVEHLETVEHRGGRHIIAVVQPVRRLAGGGQILGAQPADRLHAVAKIAPVFLERLRAGNMRGHADDRNVVLVNHRTVNFVRQGDASVLKTDCGATRRPHCKLVKFLWN